MNEVKLYNELAWTWEILVSEEEYVPEARFIQKMVKKHKKTSGNQLLDVGCGAGHHDLFLKDQYQIVGVDAGDKMLDLARKRNPELDYRKGDMREFQLNRKFDVVMAMDMLMYNRSYADLEVTLTNFSEHLKTGGVLMFYVENMKEKFEQNKTRFKRHKKGDIDIVLVENDYDPDPNDTEFECHLIFLIRKLGKFEIQVDRHRMGLFEIGKMMQILQNLDFKTYLYELDFSGRKYVKEGPFFACVKLS
ncbi:MAG: methyltransferase domain-containing protein [candidate division Zixibacteria bacterium]|nr:methyltransferase domain-containing protein [candidate division Zixibacteria bacterium]